VKKPERLGIGRRDLHPAHQLPQDDYNHGVRTHCGKAKRKTSTGDA
jgi:hypothetical protein